MGQTFRDVTVQFNQEHQPKVKEVEEEAASLEIIATFFLSLLSASFVLIS